MLTVYINGLLWFLQFGRTWELQRALSDGSFSTSRSGFLLFRNQNCVLFYVRDTWAHNLKREWFVKL